MIEKVKNLVLEVPITIRIYKDGDLYLAFCGLIQSFTQGKTEEELINNVKELISMQQDYYNLGEKDEN